MKGSRVAKRYARALLGLAPDQAQMEAWGAEIALLATIVSAPELAVRFASPELPETARIEAMAKIAERLELSFPLRSFAVVIARHGRIADLEAVSDAYRGLVDERLGRARATLIFARNPTEPEVARVSEGLGAIAGKKIIAAVQVDPALLGGVVAELEGKIYDGSLATRLEEAQRLLGG